MRIGAGGLTQKIVPFNIIAAGAHNNRRNRPPSFLQQPYRMADGAGSSNIPAPPHPIQPKPDEIAEKKEIPPPPEKPEAGDCCGSGCVRCVWDIYYDELEEYNKLYKNDNPSPKP